MAYDSPVPQPKAVGTYVGDSLGCGCAFTTISCAVVLSNENRKSSSSVKRADHGSDLGLPRRMKLSSVWRSVSWMLRAARTSIALAPVCANAAILAVIGGSNAAEELSPHKIM